MAAGAHRPLGPVGKRRRESRRRRAQLPVSPSPGLIYLLGRPRSSNYSGCGPISFTSFVHRVRSARRKSCRASGRAGALVDQAEVVQALRDLRVGQHLVHLPVHPLHDAGRRSGRGQQGEPADVLESRIGLDQGGHVLEAAHAFAGAHCKRAQFPSLEERKERGRTHQDDLRASGNRVLDRRRDTGNRGPARTGCPRSCSASGPSCR